MIFRLRIIGFCLLLAMGFTVAVWNTSASAAVGNGSCDSGELCAWIDAGYQGCFYDFHPQTLHGNFSADRWNTCPDRSLNDTISSYKNLTGSYFGFYQHIDFKGFGFCIWPNATGGNLNEFRHPRYGSPNDQFSSAQANPNYPGDETIKRECQYVDRN